MKRLSFLISTMVFGFMISTMYITSAKAADITVPDDYPTIQEAINASGDGDVVIVGVGTYVENINFLGKTITVKSEDPNDHDVVAATIIDGNQTGTTFTFNAGEGKDSLLCGFTLKNATKYGGAIACRSSSPTITNCAISNNSGSGIECHYSSPTIAHCTISNNSRSGIDCSNSSPTITHCTISNNSRGGIDCSFSSAPTITYCTISNNISWGSGGGIRCYRSSPIIINCAIIGNSASGYGGGIYGWWFAGPLAYTQSTLCKLSITNSVIAQNSASYGGGCAFEGYTTFWPPVAPFPKPRFINCTIADNIASSEGGGIYNQYTSLPILTNCILWGDSPDEIYVQRADLPYAVRANARTIRQIIPMYPKISYSDVQGGYLGRRNINADPLFVDPNAGDYHLQPDSPCIGRGKRRCNMGAYGTYEDRMPWSRSGRYLGRYGN